MNDTTATTGGFNRKWLIAFIALFMLLLSNGMSITGLPVFDESLLKEFGWTRGELKLRDLITLGLTGLLAPLVGIVIDRIGVKKVSLFGFAILTVAYYFYGNLSSLTDLYIIHALLGVVLVCCGLNVAVILVSSWFAERRGTAIGIALMGTSLAGVVFPQLGTQLIIHQGWRNAFHWEMIFPVLLIILIVFLVRNRPENATQANEDNVPQTGISFNVAIRHPTFWALAIIAMATFYTVLGAQAHLFLYTRDLGFDVQSATNIVSTFFGMALFGKFIFGFIADYIDQKKVMMGNLLVMLVASIILASMNASLIWVAVIAFGLGWGGMYTLLQLAAINSFGLRSAGKILGTITILDAFGGGLGMWLTGVLFESHGKSYEFAFQIFVGMIVVALIAAMQIRPVLENTNTP